MSVLELTATPPRKRDGVVTWMLVGDDDRPDTREHIEPAITFLAARGGGMMFLPVSD
jgi:hypothetical protein